MKPSKQKRAARPSNSRRSGVIRPKVSAKKPSARSTAARVSSKPAPRKAPRRQTPAKASAPRQQPQPERPRFAEEILAELRTLQAAVTSKPRAHPSGDDGLESATDSIRRVIRDHLERDRESILRELVLARHALADRQRPDTTAALDRLERLITQLGALEFSARQLDFVDPAIHEIKTERWVDGLPEGVVAVSLRPGFRSRNGVVLSKAWIAVNRRSAHESARD